MVFNSWIFALFLPIVLGLYLVLPHRGQNWLLLGASYLFYGWWDWRFLGLLAGTTTIDWLVGLLLEHPRLADRRKTVLAVSVVANLAVLGTFKYLGFFAASASVLAARFGIELDPVTLHVVLPVGISFYTFQSMAYTIDVYRRELPAVRSLPDFALFVAYFPQLVAGPIERATHLVPQLTQPRVITVEQWRDGVSLIVLGLVKKIAIADFVAGHVTRTFAGPANWSSLDLLLGVYAFALQIYGDFGGYSDMARGTSKLFGVELMANFRWPYFASSITDFWRRWHVSLSSWLRDYLYVPLGGNRKGPARRYLNLLITMLLGGLWHGASWTFVAWGGLHGLALAIHVAWTGARVHAGQALTAFSARWQSILGGLVTFHIVCIGWVFFRAETFTKAAAVLGGIVSLRPGWPLEALHDVLIAGSLTLLFDVMTLRSERKGEPFLGKTVLARGVMMGALLVLLLVLGDRSDVPFIYFQF